MSDDVFILDSGHTVYVWVGDDARPEEKTMAIDTGLVGFNGSFTLTETDSGSGSKPHGYIVLCRTCSHYTDSDSDPYSLFLHRTGI